MWRLRQVRGRVKPGNYLLVKGSDLKCESYCWLFCVMFVCAARAWSLDRQPGADYHARREALAKKAGGVVVLLAPLERNGRGVRISAGETIFTISGSNGVPGPADIAPAVEAKGDTPARAYTEILFLPPRNLRRRNLPAGKWARMPPTRRKETGSIESKRWWFPGEVAKLLPANVPSFTRRRPRRQGIPRVKTCWAFFSTAMRWCFSGRGAVLLFAADDQRRRGGRSDS